MLSSNTPDNNSDVQHNATIATSAPFAASKMQGNRERADKRSWFHSLTSRRRLQTQSQVSLNPTSTTMAAAEPNSSSVALLVPGQIQNNNNNNDVSLRTASIATGMEATTSADPMNLTAGANCGKKGEKNVFQRLKKKMGLHFNSLRRSKNHDLDGATTDASGEFIRHSPTREPQLSHCYNHNNSLLEEPEMIPFTLHFKPFVVKKWLEREAGPNRIMYKASSEMLGQVWYWGEISRHDAQKQLTDKPTGSFLVRDSETSGSQFTLSFRIVNVTLHYRLEYRENYWHFEELQYESIVEMIEDILFRCTNDNFVCFVRVPNEMQPPFPVILKYPLSRYLKMPQLQDLCRRVIQRHISEDEIAKLPIPSKLHEYLSEKRELVF